MSRNVYLLVGFILAYMVPAMAATPTKPVGLVTGQGDPGGWMVVGCWLGGRFVDGEPCRQHWLKQLHTLRAQTYETLASPSISWQSWSTRAAEAEDSDPCNRLGLAGSNRATAMTLNRGIKLQQTGNPLYRQMVAEVLNVKEVELRQLLRVDLEGDRTEEVLFEAAYQGPLQPYTRQRLKEMGVPIPSTSQYDAVGYRKLIKAGKVVTRVIAKGEAAYTGMRYRLKGLSDLNGDGVLEVVISERIDHGYSESLWSLQGATPKLLASGSCGW